MPTPLDRFSLRNGFIEFDRPVRTLTPVPVTGTIINSVTQQKKKLQTWKRTVASAIKEARGQAPWDPRHRYAVTLNFRFHPANHGFQELDVENFIKPVLDAVAAGLFVEEHIDPNHLQHWSFDDSNFRTLLIHRGPNPSNPNGEGVQVFVSAQEP